MPVIHTIEEASRQGQALQAIYAELRTEDDAGARGVLLRRAGAHAEALVSCVRRAVEESGGGEPDENAREALQALGGLMEQVMIQEREYRLDARSTSSGPGED